MPKNSALLNEIEAVLKIYYDHNGWLSNEVYKEKLKAMIGDDQYESSYTKKAQITSYFGFTVWEDINNSHSLRKITDSGRKMYEAIRDRNTSKIQDALMESLEKTTFGRNNYGCPDSKSDIEPPCLFIRASIELGYLTYKEFAYLLWKLEDIGENYSDAINELKSFRLNNNFELGEEAQKYTDAKPIMILVRWGFLEEDTEANAGGKHIKVSSIVLRKFVNRLRNLKVYNIDKDLILDNNCDELEYKFKHLLSWFVKQLNINNDLAEGTKTSGKGCDGDAIQSKYVDWRDYGSFTLDCTMQCGYLSASNKVNYIHKSNTGINIRPNFNKDTKEVTSLSLDLWNYDLTSLSEKIASILEKEYPITDLSLFDGLEPNDKLKELFDNYAFIIEKLSNNEDEKADIPVFDFNQSNELAEKGKNLVVYGTPGCGKSYYVEHKLLKESEYPLNADGTKERVIRTTFFQDYTNTDFVGQILPIVEGDKVTYKFNPGPFTLALVEAIKNPNKKVALVIEELNRGNAPSIFGDIFQLLDRKDGVSEYSIVNVNLIRYLNDVFKAQYSFEFIKIPSNLFIYATMNTSDQNVFTLDTAFKRRWEFMKLSNTFEADHKFKNKYIPGDKITWEKLVNDINDWILNNADGYNSEDKQIGVYFVDDAGMTVDVIDRQNMNKDDARKFAYKIMEYLWDDVAKFQREKWFKDNINSLDKLIDEYIDEGVEVFKDGVIKKHE